MHPPLATGSLSSYTPILVEELCATKKMGQGSSAVQAQGTIGATYILLRSADNGMHLSGEAELLPHAGDGCIWQLSDGQARSLASRTAFLLRGEPPYLLGDRSDLGRFWIVAGPPRLPSQHLRELRDDGLTVIPDVISPESLVALKALISRVRSQRFPQEPPTDGLLRMD